MTGHIRARSAGSWELRVSLGADPRTGKRRITTQTVKGSRRDAERALRQLLAAADAGETADPGRITTGQWLTKWLATVRLDEVSPRTAERYAELVTQFLIPALGALPLRKLAAVHIQDMLTDLASSGRRDGRPGGLSPQTRRHIYRVLTGALNRAIEEQLLSRNPAAALRRRMPKVERPEMATLTAEQARQLLAALRHLRVYWPVLIALATGARRNEVLALRWKVIDLDRGVATITQSIEETRSGLRFKTPKSGRSRAVPLPTFAVDELRRHRREQAEELLALGVRQTADTLLCRRADPFTDGTLDRDAAMTGRAVGHEYRRAIRALNPALPYVRFHDLRHSHASILLASGVHPKVVQERLGHATISITLDVYSHLATTMQADAAARLDEALRSTPVSNSGSKF
jgi:integrase